MKSANLKTIALWGAGTFAALWIAENYLGIDISHHAAKKAAAPKAAKGAKAPKGGAAAGGAAAPAAATDTTTAAAPAASGFTCDSCTAGAGGSFTCTNCTSAGGAAAGGGNVWGQNPASKTPCDIPGQPCPTVGALGGTSQWCKCVAGGGGGSTTPAASAAAVAYAYQGWAIAR